MTVTTCGPTADANVQLTDDSPLLSVVDVVALSDPPPTTAHFERNAAHRFPRPVEHAYDEGRIDAVATFAD